MGVINVVVTIHRRCGGGMRHSGVAGVFIQVNMAARLRVESSDAGLDDGQHRMCIATDGLQSLTVHQQCAPRR